MSESKTVTPLRTGAKMLSIMPESLDDVARMAKMAVLAGIGQFKPDDKNDFDTCLARASMCIMQGLEVGLPPMQALQLIAMIGNRFTVHSEGVPALLWAKGFKVRQWIEGAGDQRTGHAEVTRPDGTKIAGSFSVAQAKKARLWDDRQKVMKWKRGGQGQYEAENDSAWHRFDDDMLQARALSRASKRGAADALRGLTTREDVEDARMIDVTPAKASVAAPAAMPDTPDDIPEAPAEEESIADVAGYLEQIEGVLAGCETEQEVQEAWEQDEKTVETRIERSQRQQFYDAVETHMKRVAAVKAQAAE